ncbi:Protein of unknown function DUF177 [Syntrophomonas zehnderi OL-4]|uniref:Large ribosomal RNA subunit accumulation protein YceD n=1 Tax=Syntrophomonas zehnderi OL-4 TaxID=690567 RepID=A0A0E4C9L9_9FIRM|nr:DUF177 domain-containing protein [Syntrophomonas zehnderi]CFY05236.1 Protein of unknown function DUF177 [Syntrophomonas zehnderi OL-4]
MKINLARLKFRPQESETFFLHAPGPNEILQDLGGKFLDQVTVELVVENTGRLFLAHGKVQTRVQLQCSRCLKECSYPIFTDIEMELVRSTSTAAENISEDEDCVFFTGDIADISAPVYEAIYLAIPIIPLCKENCQGLCSICGIDKNTGDCTCVNEDIDPRWEKLKNL